MHSRILAPVWPEVFHSPDTNNQSFDCYCPFPVDRRLAWIAHVAVHFELERLAVDCGIDDVIDVVGRSVALPMVTTAVVSGGWADVGLVKAHDETVKADYSAAVAAVVDSIDLIALVLPAKQNTGCFAFPTVVHRLMMHLLMSTSLSPPHPAVETVFQAVARSTRATKCGPDQWNLLPRRHPQPFLHRWTDTNICGRVSS